MSCSAFFLLSRTNTNVNDALGDYSLTLVDSLDTLVVRKEGGKREEGRGREGGGKREEGKREGGRGGGGGGWKGGGREEGCK